MEIGVTNNKAKIGDDSLFMVFPNGMAPIPDMEQRGGIRQVEERIAQRYPSRRAESLY